MCDLNLSLDVPERLPERELTAATLDVCGARLEAFAIRKLADLAYDA